MKLHAGMRRAIWRQCLDGLVPCAHPSRGTRHVSTQCDLPNILLLIRRTCSEKRNEVLDLSIRPNSDVVVFQTQALGFVVKLATDVFEAVRFDPVFVESMASEALRVSLDEKKASIFREGVLSSC